jgi:hypothetical protein
MKLVHILILAAPLSCYNNPIKTGCKFGTPSQALGSQFPRRKMFLLSALEIYLPSGLQANIEVRSTEL